jgi:tRNA U34 5-carboxymethylaminomethyl modifying GTPase MnmE/TrmE
MVVVAGRPNVGKSSLVNRIVGARATVVEEEKGVTRDRKELTAEWNGVPFSIMDTGGWLAAGDALEAKVSDQAERALAEADVILMVVDVTTGVTDEDLGAAKVIRRDCLPAHHTLDQPSPPPGSARGQQGRRCQPGHRHLGLRLTRSGRSVPRQLPARAGHR